MDKKSIRHIDTMSGSGQLLVGSSKYRVAYKVEVYQEYIEVQSGDLAGLKDMSGNLRVLEDNVSALFNNEEAVLILSDGRKIGINLHPLLEPKKDFEFTLRYAMDLKE